MASKLAERHIELNAQLRTRTVAQLTRIWNSLPEYRDSTLPAWLQTVIPLVQAAQRAEIDLTNAYIARALDRPVKGVDADRIMAQYRNGASHEDVYKRPFGEVWTALAGGAPFEAAREQGLARAAQTAATDIQLAMRDTALAVEKTYGDFGYQRVADGDACAFCQEVDGAYVKGEAFVMDLHPGCGCGIEPLAEPHKGAVYLPDGTQVRPYAHGPLNDNVAIKQHGELGGVLWNPAHDFTPEANL